MSYSLWQGISCFILRQRRFSPLGVQHVRHSSCVQVFLAKEQLSLDVIKQCRVKCPTVVDKQKVLREMIFPNCEKLGQTIIFVRTRETARSLHALVQPLCLLLIMYSAYTDQYHCTLLCQPAHILEHMLDMRKNTISRMWSCLFGRYLTGMRV